MVHFTLLFNLNIDLPSHRHGHRADGYGPSSYFDEFGQVVQAMQSNSKINKLDYLIGPSIAHADWTGEQVWDTNFVPSYSQYLGAITVEKYVFTNRLDRYQLTQH